MFSGPVSDSVWVGLGAACSAIVASMTFRYHMRKLKHVDVMEGGVSISLAVVLEAMRDEIQRSKVELQRMSDKIMHLEAENATMKRTLMENGICWTVNPADGMG